MTAETGLPIPHRPAKIPKNLSKYTNKLFFLTVTLITGDPCPFRKFELQRRSF